MADFTPHTDAEIDDMLAFCGLASVEELFATVPAAIRLAAGLELPPGRSEPDTLAELERLAAANRVGRELVCFAGAGAYDHDVASVVRRVASGASSSPPTRPTSPRWHRVCCRRCSSTRPSSPG